MDESTSAQPSNTSHTTIAHEIERFLNQRAARSVHTARTYRTGLSHFLTYLAERGISPEDPPALLTRAVALDFIPWLAQQRFAPDATAPEQPLSMRSRQLYVRAVSGLYRQLALEGTIPLSYGDYAALNAEMNKETSFRPPPIEKRLPPDEVVEVILETVRQPPPELERTDLDEAARQRFKLIWLRDQAIVLSLYSTGMRVSELVRLCRGDLDHTDQGAWVHGKGGRTRFVRFSNQAWQALMHYLTERRDSLAPGAPADKPVFCRHDRAAGGRRLPLSTYSVERLITRLARESGVLERFNLTPHSFRHYFATRFLGFTGDLALTQDVLGHADPGTTRVYAKTTKAQHIRAHRSLFDRNTEDEEGL
ncbi:MAG: tyrosine-type recombinase/integrase [Anaerolineae bacterium]